MHSTTTSKCDTRGYLKALYECVNVIGDEMDKIRMTGLPDTIREWSVEKRNRIIGYVMDGMTLNEAIQKEENDV